MPGRRSSSCGVTAIKIPLDTPRPAHGGAPLSLASRCELGGRHATLFFDSSRSMVPAGLSWETLQEARGYREAFAASIRPRAFHPCPHRTLLSTRASCAIASGREYPGIAKAPGRAEGILQLRSAMFGSSSSVNPVTGRSPKDLTFPDVESDA